MTSMDSPVSIPQTDPRAGYLAQRTAIDVAIARVLEGGAYILGREVEAFEAAFADFVGVAHAIGVASGTDAIEVALRVCGAGRCRAQRLYDGSARALARAADAAAWPAGGGPAGAHLRPAGLVART